MSFRGKVMVNTPKYYEVLIGSERITNGMARIIGQFEGTSGLTK